MPSHSLEARNFAEDVYRLDLRGAFGKEDDAKARDFAKPVPRVESIKDAEPGQSEMQTRCWFGPRQVTFA